MNRQQQIDHFLMAAHRLAMSRLRADPSRIEKVRAQLVRWRGISGVTRSDTYWDEWQALLDSGVDELERVVCAEDDHGAVLRSVSPASVLLTQRERSVLLREARAA
jgi:hypothetical protein